MNQEHQVTSSSRNLPGDINYQVIPNKMTLIKFKRFKIVLLALVGFVLAITIYGLLQLIEPVAIAKSPQSPLPVTFTGDKLLIASDADMVATAYADAKLDRVAGIEDTLTVIDLPLDSNNPQIASIGVSLDAFTLHFKILKRLMEKEQSK